MKLTVLERVVLLGILPDEGNFVTLRILRKLREVLGFTEEEFKTFSLKQEGEHLTWNPEVDASGGVEITIGEKATDLIVEALKTLDRNKKLTAQHFSVYEKFCCEESS